MAQKKENLKLTEKVKTIPIKRQRNPRVPTPAQYSLDAVRRAADTLEGLGFNRVFALETIAAQLHENLLALKKRGGK